MTEHPEEDVEVRDLWQAVVDAVEPGVRQRVTTLVAQRAEELSRIFYTEMMAHPAATRLLDHATVNARLHASMQQWLRHLFDPQVALDQSILAQRTTGAVHARIGVSMDLIARGARVLKRSLALALVAADLAPTQLVNAIQYVYELIDVAIDTMNHAYARDARRIDRSDEAYRMMFLGRDLRAERERQRSQLLEWAQQILMQYYWDRDAVPGIQGRGFAMSQFGLWITHKASVLFGDAPEIHRIRERVESIEDDLLPRLAAARGKADQAREVVAAINSDIEQIKSMLSAMFDGFIESQDGRDSLTQLLNRRYLPTIAKREIDLAQRGAGPFAILLVDVDHFARVRAAAQAGDGERVLSQVADALLDSVRAGDFVFRVGDDRFCILMVEAARADMQAIADGLRERIGGLNLAVGPATSTTVSVSLGVAMFDGHPDYQRVIDRAEDALLQAKQQGRNRCVLAD